MTTPLVAIDEICQWWDAKMKGSLPEDVPSVDHAFLVSALSMVPFKETHHLIQQFVDRVTTKGYNPAASGAAAAISACAKDGRDTLARAFLDMLVEYEGKSYSLGEYVYTDLTKSCAFYDITFPSHEVLSEGTISETPKMCDTISRANLELSEYGVPKPGEYKDILLHYVREYLVNDYTGIILHDEEYHGDYEPSVLPVGVLCEFVTDRMYDNMNRHAYAVLHLSASIFYAFVIGHAGYTPRGSRSVTKCFEGEGEVGEIPLDLRSVRDDVDFQIGKSTPIHLARMMWKSRVKMERMCIPSLIKGRPDIDVYGYDTFFWFVVQNGEFIYTIDVSDPEMGNVDLRNTFYDHLNEMIGNLRKIRSD